MIRTKRVKEPRSPDDGTRVLVMRLWPRGVKKTHVDEWERELGPPVELLRAVLADEIPWSRFERSYVAHVRARAKEPLEELRRRSDEGETITILCWCPDEERCHRSILRRLLTGTEEREKAAKAKRKRRGAS